MFFYAVKRPFGVYMELIWCKLDMSPLNLKEEKSLISEKSKRVFTFTVFGKDIEGRSVLYLEFKLLKKTLRFPKIRVG